MFNAEPVGLRFGHKKDPNTQDLWKTPFGGVTTLLFAVILAMYVVSSFAALDSGDKDMTTVFERESGLLTMKKLSFEEMKVMPVVTFTFSTPHLYIDT